MSPWFASPTRRMLWVAVALALPLTYAWRTCLPTLVDAYAQAIMFAHGSPKGALPAPPAVMVLYALTARLCSTPIHFAACWTALAYAFDALQKWLLYRHMTVRSRGFAWVMVMLHSLWGWALSDAYLMQPELWAATLLLLALTLWSKRGDSPGGWLCLGLAGAIAWWVWAVVPVVFSQGYHHNQRLGRQLGGLVLALGLTVVPSYVTHSIWGLPWGAGLWAAHGGALHAGSSYGVLALLVHGLHLNDGIAHATGALRIVAPFAKTLLQLVPMTTAALVGATCIWHGYTLRQSSRIDRQTLLWRASAALLCAFLLATPVLLPQYLTCLMPVMLVACLWNNRFDNLLATLTTLALSTTAWAVAFDAQTDLARPWLTVVIAMRWGVLLALFVYLLRQSSPPATDDEIDDPISVGVGLQSQTGPTA